MDGPAVSDGTVAFLAEHGIDEQWLVERLTDAGLVDPAARLADMTAKSIGTGQVGENVRCRFDWADGAGPDSVVLKLPSMSEISRATAAATRTYVREVGFYRDLRHQVDIRTPAPYFIDEDQANNAFVLVMEDILPAEQGDQLSGCTPPQAALAVDAIAGLHGPTWGRDDLAELDWVDESTPESIDQRAELLAALFPGFVERYRDVLTEPELEAGRWLTDSVSALASAPTGPKCMMHGDFRLDNLLFGTGPGAPPITTVDWQTITYGYGLTDLAYFISAGLSPTDRRANEGALLDRYRAGLAAHGVELDLDAVRRGYRLGSAAGYLMAVIASQIVEQTERGDAMFVAMARGSAQLLIDLELPSLVGA